MTEVVTAVRDLSQDEAAGGHILRKHVGQTDEQLRERGHTYYHDGGGHEDFDERETGCFQGALDLFARRGPGCALGAALVESGRSGR